MWLHFWSVRRQGLRLRTDPGNTMREFRNVTASPDPDFHGSLGSHARIILAQHTPQPQSLYADYGVRLRIEILTPLENGCGDGEALEAIGPPLKGFLDDETQKC